MAFRRRAGPCAGLNAACFGFPRLAPGQWASAGVAKDCVTNKIDQFAAELGDPNTPKSERIFALKFLLHFVGDLHQPLHAADDHDRGGNCVLITTSTGTIKLHSYWDTAVVKTLGADAPSIAQALRKNITPALRRRWEAGDPRLWTLESFGLARSVVYRIPTHTPNCERDPRPVPVSLAYEKKASTIAATQLEKAGVRLAGILNRALG